MSAGEVLNAGNHIVQVHLSSLILNRMELIEAITEVRAILIGKQDSLQRRINHGESRAQTQLCYNRLAHAHSILMGVLAACPGPGGAGENAYDASHTFTEAPDHAKS